MTLLQMHRRFAPPAPSSASRGRRKRNAQHFHPLVEILEGRLLLSVFTVTNTNDSGTGSLRQAILDANGNPGLDTIAFNIGRGGVQTIVPSSALPAVTDAVVIDGTTQPGFTGTPLIVLDGSSAGSQASGLVISGGDSTVRGLVISGFGQDGIGLRDGGGDVVVGNYVGTDATGTQLLGNHRWGVNVSSAGNTIGGVRRGDGNVISGNHLAGIYILHGDHSVVQGNFIGTDVTGTRALGNRDLGVFLSAGSDVTIGGTGAGARNLISGNQNSGIYLETSHENYVQGNYIGTDITGTEPLGNGGGVVDSGVNDTIGGTVAGTGNLISGNRGAGVFFSGDTFSGSGRNVLAGNWIGTDVTGSHPLGNGGTGVSLYLSVANLIGGTAAGAGNVISGNATDGVYVGTDGTRLEGNFIGTDRRGAHALANGGAGIRVPGVQHTTIGGTTEGAGNLISGNAGAGIGINYYGGRDFLIQGNFIGTDAAGTHRLPNEDSGVVIDGYDFRLDAGVTIGGTDAGARNLVSGNRADGIHITGSGVQVLGNTIGTDITGANALANGDNGIAIEAGGRSNTIGGTLPNAGNLISGNQNAGVVITDSAFATVLQGNYIGTNATGTAAVGNGGDGVLLQGVSGNTIGGEIFGAVNLISGNGGNGINIRGGSGDRVLFNRIGTDYSATAAIGNAMDGIILQDGASYHTIGGPTQETGNIISGNTLDGVFIGENSQGNLVQGNFIGTDALGTSALGNLDGVFIDAAADNTIGGTSILTGNVISGNNRYGIMVFRWSQDNVLLGNHIGTDPSGTIPLGNGYTGVTFADYSFDNTVGGTPAGAGNMIAFNGFDGVLVDTGYGNAILRNSIFGHDNAFGIELYHGGNNNQAFPTITSAISSGGLTTIEGTLSSYPSTTFALEFFVNSVCNPNGGEGERFLASTTVITDADGNASFSLTVAIGVDPGQFIAATATDPAGNTSQFSQCAEVKGPALPSTSGVGLVGLTPTELPRIRTGGLSGLPGNLESKGPTPMADHGFPIPARSEGFVNHLAKTGCTPSLGEWDLFFQTFEKDLLTENPVPAFH
jgi:hypothetical protein